MHLESFILADAATVAEGKLYVHGGGISRINAPSLPLAMQLTAAIRLIIDREDLGRSHQVMLVVVDPDGSMLMPPISFEPVFEDRNPQMLPDEEQSLQVTLGMGLQFSRAGTYRIKLTVDEEVLRDMPLPVATLTEDQFRELAVHQPPSPPPPQQNRAQRRTQNPRSKPR